MPMNYSRDPSPVSRVQAHWDRQARECLLWNMSPEVWDALTLEQHAAFVKQWNKIQKEQQPKKSS